MDIVPPDPKRTRVDSWSNEPAAHHRALPTPYPRPSPQPSRHSHSDERRYYGSEDHRGPQQPSLTHNPFGVPRDSREPVVKLDPSSESPLHVRPHSTGHIAEGHGIPPHPEDPRRQSMAGYDQTSRPSPSPTYRGAPSYPLPPPPPPVNSYYDRTPYEAANSGPPRETIYADIHYTGPISKKKVPRTSQACDACRAAKAKCTDPKPCQSCVEKNIECHYEPPVPKQGDKFQTEILSLLETIKEGQKNLEKKIESQLRSFDTKHEILERSLLKTVPDLEAKLKQEKARDCQEDKTVLHDMSSILSQPQVKPEEDPQHSPPSFSMDIDQAPESQEEDEDDDSGPPIVKELPSIPPGHTTGAARMLQWPAVTEIVSMRINPWRKERKRGVIRLYGRGEGQDTAAGYEKDQMLDPSPDNDDSSSEASASPAADNLWGQVGGTNSPLPEPSGMRPEGLPQRDIVDFHGLPEDEETVRRLAQSYMAHLNIMHPIITPGRLDTMIKNYFREVADTNIKGERVRAGFVNNLAESTGAKRKRSPAFDSSNERPSYLKPGKPQRSISVALVLLVCALGKICEHKGKIPDVIHDQEISITSSPIVKNAHPSPNQPSSASSTQSPGFSILGDSERPRNNGRRTSVEANLPPRASIRERNADVIPGLGYFSIASDIIGNSVGDTSLQYVHANLLAGLYHGQLARVLQSHAYIYNAGYALRQLIEPSLKRFRQLLDNNRLALPKDNPLIFAFWTCLQLESDIIAELGVPQSEILSLEESVPYPNLQSAVDVGEMQDWQMHCYLGQLWLRKHLNAIHRDLYGPGKEEEFSLSKPRDYGIIDVYCKNLEGFPTAVPTVLWNFEGDKPANNILEARLRAKYYGARVITYRHFVRMVLNNRFSDNPIEEIPRSVLAYAEEGVKATIESTKAFFGMGSSRLIITNVWGTAHAQWGNLLVLHAAYLNPQLQSLITADVLRDLTSKIKAFLRNIAQPSSALSTDLKILEIASQKAGLTTTSVATSFSSSSGAPTPYR